MGDSGVEFIEGLSQLPPAERRPRSLQPQIFVD